MLKMEKVFVTGGSGFLGRSIIEKARLAGYGVIAPRSNELDLENSDECKKYFNKLNDNGETINYIIHSAAYYGGLGFNSLDPVGLIDKNSRMALNVFACCKDIKPKKIISVGSACSYPGHLTNDLREKEIFNGPCQHSVEQYGFTKRLHIILQSAYFKQYKFKSNQLALTNLYGEHDTFHEKRSHALPTLIKKIVDAKMYNKDVVAWGTGTPIREFLYVHDAAKIIVESLKFKHDLEPINVGGEEISIRDLTKLICGIVDYDYNLVKWDNEKPDGTKRKVLDSSKLSKLYNNINYISLQQGLNKTIKWYIENKKMADQRL